MKQNLLYDLLKRRSARQLERPLTRFPFQSLLSLIGAAALLCPAVAATLVEAVFRRGGTIEVYAKKRQGGPSRLSSSRTRRASALLRHVFGLAYRGQKSGGAL